MSGRRQRHESVPWRARLSVKWRDYTLRRRAKRRAKEFVGMSPEQAELHADDFWQIPSRSPDATMGEDELAEILKEGLRLHLSSDVPLAVLLSGGVDSSVVANLAQRAQ